LITQTKLVGEIRQKNIYCIKERKIFLYLVQSFSKGW